MNLKEIQRLPTTLENIQYILKYKKCVEIGDTDTADNYFRTMVQSYPGTV